ncbi:MAG: hypothetical protein WAL56_24640, partial [Candidatus Sulfotelmatobacter sp.]
MKQGTKAEAIELAKVRWAQQWSFDLEETIWESLFAEYKAGEILTAIRKTAGTRNPAPDAAYRALLYWTNRLQADRLERKAAATWPP